MTESWDSCDLVQQADLIAYSEVRDYEENEADMQFHKLVATAMGAR